MVKIPYITFREEQEGVLKYFVLQKDFPHNLGAISIMPNIKSVVQSTVPGYNLWIVHCGVLRGNLVAVYPNYKVETQEIYDSMANWFLSERIKKDEKRYEKFKVKSNVPTTGE